jgi:colicin import membrane protein
MTSSVADKTPISAKVWRRHTDPPGFWIAVVVGSVSLHLLVFWLIRSTGFSRLTQQQNKAAIPIEVVEISSQTKPRARKIASKPRAVSPKPEYRNQNKQATNSPKQVVRQDKLTAKPAPDAQDRSGIAFAEQRQREQAEQLQRQQAQQLQREQDEQRQREQAQQLQREQTEQLQAQQLQREQDEQRQREQAQQLQREQTEQLQAQQLQREQTEQLQAQQLQREQDEQRQREQAQQLQREQDEQRQREQAQQLQREQTEQLQAQQLQREQDEQRQREQAQQTNTQASSPPTSSDVPARTNTQEPSSQISNAPIGRLLASLVGEPQQLERDIHTHPAVIKPSDEPFSKGLEYVKFIEGKPGQPVEFTAILTISEKGKLEKIAIQDDAVPVDERSYYEDFVADEVFKGWEFQPAYDNDPNDPKPSNLIVRIKIQPLP